MRAATRSRAVVRLLLPVLGVIVIAVLGFAIWSTDPKPGVPTPPVGPPAESVATGSVADQVRTSTVHGSQAGYDAAVKITQDAVGSTTVTALDVVLTTQATPASAPTAEASLVGADRVRHDVPLDIIGAGHWTSRQFTVPPSRYRLTARFDRQGAPVIIAMTVVLT